MSQGDKSIRQQLNQLNLQEYMLTQRKLGRANLSLEFKAFWRERHLEALELLNDNRRGRRVRNLAGLLRDVTYSINAMETQERITYYPYTDTHISDWYLTGPHKPFLYLKQKVGNAIFYLLQHYLHFEAESVAEVETSHREKFSKEIVIDQRLEKIRQAVVVCKGYFKRIQTPPPDSEFAIPSLRTLEDYLSDNTRLSALIHLTGIPQTIFHDEVLFLRTIQVGEFCFYGIRMAIIETIECINAKKVSVAIQRIGEASTLAELLHKMFVVLRTMPPEHFIDFRDYTEDASAVQSRNYQLMDIYLRGVDNRKLQVYSDPKRAHLSDLKKFYHKSFTSLKSLIERGSGEIDESNWSEFINATKILDEKLLTWRGLHLGFARGYLPPATEATGGTAGAPYLQKFLKGGIFAETEPDKSLIQEIFPDLEESLEERRVPAGHSFAPPEDLRTTSRTKLKYPEMLVIPAGIFLMGSDSKFDQHSREDELPQHEVELPRYSISRTPITNRQYEVFVKATQHRLPKNWLGKGIPVGREDYPVTTVSLFDALAYAKWLSLAHKCVYTIPSEAEWEKAARSTDARLYPWGNQWDPNLCNSEESNRHDIVSVERFPDGVSVYKLMGMGGNVFEWTRSSYKPYPFVLSDNFETTIENINAPVLRGCGCQMGREYSRCASRMFFDPMGNVIDKNLLVPDLSFRVVKSLTVDIALKST